MDAASRWGADADGLEEQLIAWAHDAATVDAELALATTQCEALHSRQAQLEIAITETEARAQVDKTSPADAAVASMSPMSRKLFMQRHRSPLPQSPSMDLHEQQDAEIRSSSVSTSMQTVSVMTTLPATFYTSRGHCESGSGKVLGCMCSLLQKEP